MSRVIAMPTTPAAPTISISRDPRMGPRLAPVFWIGAIEDDELLHEVGLGLFAGTDGKGLLWHTLRHGASPFLLVPLMFHLVDEVEFVEAVRRYLHQYDRHEVPWFEERCELTIFHNGLRCRALPTAGPASFEVISSPIADE